jgi:hypothetical protein
MQAQTHATCPTCGEQFAIAAIAEHPDVAPVGMLFEDEVHHRHMYHFTHVAAHCGTTFVVPVEAFLPYLSEPVREKSLIASDRCEQLCRHSDELDACHQPCRHAPFRRHMVSMIQRRAKITGQRPAK